MLVRRRTVGNRRRGGGYFPSRRGSVGASGAVAVRGERGLCPVVQRPLCCDRHELLRSVVDEANDLRAGFVVEAAACENLRDLFAELAIALKGYLYVLPDRGGKARSKRRALGAFAMW